MKGAWPRAGLGDVEKFAGQGIVSHAAQDGLRVVGVQARPFGGQDSRARQNPLGERGGIHDRTRDSPKGNGSRAHWGIPFMFTAA